MKNFTFFKALISFCLLTFFSFTVHAQNALTLTMNDSYGDGWQGCEITIIDGNDCNAAVVAGPFTFTSGSSATEAISLPDGCYTVESSDDTYDSEVSWTITFDSDGSTWVDAPSPGSNQSFTGLTIGAGACTAVSGCTNPAATNYDPAATCDDGSCVLPGSTGLTLTMNDSYGDGWQGCEITIIDGNDCNAAVVAGPFTLTSGSSATEAISLPDGCYTVESSDDTYDSEVSWTITFDSDGSTWVDAPSPGSNQSFANLTIGAGACTAVFGCTDPAAANYDPAATCDDGSCLPCVPPAGAGTIVDDCANAQFNVDVQLTTAGDATAPVVTDDMGGSFPIPVSGLVTAGPYASGASVNLTIVHNNDATCNVDLGAFTFTCPPPNDACSDAITIDCTASPVSGTTTDSTLDAEYQDCGVGAGSPTTERGVWYKYVGDDQEVTITTCDATGGVGYDTRISVFSGADCTALSCVTGNDDMSPACAMGSYRSEVSFNANSGTDYWILIHGYQSGTGLSATGDFLLDMTCSPLCSPIPTNEDCASAEALPDCSAPATGDNTCALPTSGGNPACFSSFATLPDVWYSFTAASDAHAITITNVGATAALGMQVYDACGGTAVGACISAVTSGASNTITGLTSGSTYYIRVLSTATDAGEFTICGAPTVANNDCGVDAVNLNGGGTPGMPTGSPVSATTVGATDSGTAPCDVANNPDDDVWFEFTTDTDGGDVTITIGSTGITSAVCEVFAACPAATNNAIVCGNPGDTNITIAGTSANTQYFIRVYDSSAGFTGGGADERAAGGFNISVAGSALPAEIVSFTGKAMDKYNTLKWETASEQNTSEFSIERSQNGLDNWEVIGTERAAGTSDAFLTYSFDDMRPLSQGYYRINTIDLDGTSQVTNIISIKRDASGFDIVLIAPNPTTAKTIVTFESLDNTQINATVTDITGKVISTLTQDAIRGLNNMTINLSNVPSGIYFLTVNNGVNNITRRIVKN